MVSWLVSLFKNLQRVSLRVEKQAKTAKKSPKGLFRADSMSAVFFFAFFLPQGKLSLLFFLPLQA